MMHGWETSGMSAYPSPGDPDVPFVRLRFWATNYQQACKPLSSFTLQYDVDKPDFVVVEPLDWQRPR
jgi:hypothetical protein